MGMPRVADLKAGEWQKHVRFPGINVKELLTSADNPLASINVIQVPPSGVIGRHRHTKELETIWIINGEAVLTLDQTDVRLCDGQIIAIPIGLEHALRNESQSMVELLTFFTPPLA